MKITRFKNKYNAKRTANGFPSKLEESIYNNLLLLEKANKIKDLKRQDCVSMTDAGIRCKIDFSFIENDTGKKAYVEAKGFETERWLIIKKLWKYYGAGVLYIYGGTYRKPFLKETINPTKNIITGSILYSDV